MADELHLRRQGSNRRDIRAAAHDFTRSLRVISKQRTLNADFSAKALFPNQNQGSEKESSGGLKKREPEIRWSPTAKKKPGQFFKNWISHSEMTRPGSQPNYGWVTPEPEPTEEELRRYKREMHERLKSRPKIKVTWHDMDPRTGGPITGEDQDEKGLGRRLSQMLPGGSVGGRAARGAGLIVDDLGKFRCPPGTPAANQFTDEFGTNCFEPIGFLREAIHDIGRLFRRNFDYVEPVSKEKLARLRGLTDSVGGTEEDLQQAMEARDKAINSLKGRLGTSMSTEMNEDLFEIIDVLSKNGEWDIEWKGLLTDLWGEKFEWDDDLSAKENLAIYRERLRESFAGLFSPDDDGIAAVIDAVDRGDQFLGDIFDKLEREHTATMRGVLSAMLQSFEENPEFAKTTSKIENLIHDPKDPRALNEFGFTTIDAATGRAVVKINFQAHVLKQYLFDKDGQPTYVVKKGKFTEISADSDATEAERMDALRSWMQDQSRTEAWMIAYQKAYGSDMTEALYGSIEARAAQITFHEMFHSAQYEGVKKLVIDKLDAGEPVYYVDGAGNMVEVVGPAEEVTGAQMARAANFALLSPHLANNDRIPPYGVNDLEGSMLHLLAGGYYQSMIDDYFAGSFQDDTHAPRMVLEATAEMYALQKMGILKGPEVENATKWIEDVGGPADWEPGTPSPPMAPSTPTGPGSPSSTIDPPDPDVDETVDLLVPQSVSVVLDRETGELLPAQTPTGRSDALIQEILRNNLSNSTFAQQVRSHVNDEFGFEDISYRYIKGGELNSRYEQLEKYSQELLDKLKEGGEGLDEDEIARLYFALRGMQQILNENNRRERLSPDAALAARRAGEETSPGFYRMTTLSQEGIDIKGIDDLTKSALFLYSKKSWGKRGVVKAKRADWDLAKNEMRAWRQSGSPAYGLMLEPLIPRYKPGRVRGLDEQRSLRGRASSLQKSARLDEAIKNAATRRAMGQGEAIESSDDMSPSDEFVKFVMPIMKDIDEIPVDRETTVRASIDGATDISVGSVISHESMIHGRITGPENEDASLSIPDNQGRSIRIVVPKGGRGVLRKNAENEFDESFIIPPGELTIISVDDDGTLVAIPTKQMSLKEVSQGLSSKVKRLPPTESAGEISERNRLLRAAKMGSASSPRGREGFSSRQSNRSEDLSSSVFSEIKRRAVEGELGKIGFNPFGAGERTPVDTPDPILKDIEAFFQRVSAVSPETQTFVSTNTPDQVRQMIDNSALSFIDGFDRRIRFPMDLDGVDNVLLEGGLRHSESTATPAQAFLKQRVDSLMNYPDDMPDNLRPVTGIYVHRDHEKARSAGFAEAAEPGLGFSLRNEEFLSSSKMQSEASGSFVPGNNQIVLKKDVSRRSSISRQTGPSGERRPALMTSNDPNNFLNAIRDNDSEQSNKLIDDLIAGGLKGDMSRVLEGRGRYDGFVHGGFDVSDIEHVRVDLDELAKKRPAFISDEDLGRNNVSVTSALRKAGLSPEEIDRFFSYMSDNTNTDFDEIINVMPYLRMAKAAEAERIRLEKLGVQSIFPNRWGIDILDPDTFTSLPHGYKVRSGDAVEVLRQLVSSQIAKNASQIKRKIRPQTKQPKGGSVA